MNRLHKGVAWCAVAALWLCGSAEAASVRAWLDRTSMQLGETVTLNVEVSGDTSAAQPDLGALAQDFDLLGTQSSTSVNMVNGQTSTKLLWAVALSPKREGTLTIPALSVAGQQTPPLTLSVQAAAGGSTGGDVYIEATVEPHSPYVQQQIRLSVKLYYALNLLDGNLADPQADGLIVRKLGQDSNYNASVGGRNYHVVERRYAVFPETSGTLTLPSVVFRGHAVDGNSLDLFLNRGREIGARSQPITLDVRPRPAASGNDAWLPARSVTLSATGIDATSTVHAGEPLTLTLRIQAQGLGFEQLPELKLPAIEGIDIYPDKAATQNRDDGEWLYGDRERKFAIVPNRAGTLTLPAISIAWWDTAHDRAETASLPALTLDVQPGASGQEHVSAPNSTNLTQQVTPPIAAPNPGLGTNAGDIRLWQGIAAGAVVLWLLTIVAFWRARWPRRAEPAARTPANAESEPSRRAFAAACDRQDFAGASRILLGRARSRRPELRNLGDLERSLLDPAQKQAICDLERARFGAGDLAGLAATLKAAFARPLSLSGTATSNGSSPALPELYTTRV